MIQLIFAKSNRKSDKIFSTHFTKELYKLGYQGSQKFNQIWLSWSCNTQLISGEILTRVFQNKFYSCNEYIYTISEFAKCLDFLGWQEPYKHKQLLVQHTYLERTEWH